MLQTKLIMDVIGIIRGGGRKPKHQTMKSSSDFKNCTESTENKEQGRQNETGPLKGEKRAVRKLHRALFIGLCSYRVKDEVQKPGYKKDHILVIPWAWSSLHLQTKPKSCTLRPWTWMNLLVGGNRNRCQWRKQSGQCKATLEQADILEQRHGQRFNCCFAL